MAGRARLLVYALLKHARAHWGRRCRSQTLSELWAVRHMSWSCVDQHISACWRLEWLPHCCLCCRPAAVPPRRRRPARPGRTRSPCCRLLPAAAGREAHLDEDDEIAALEAIRVALTEVGDGVSFVWHRRYGELGGLVQPTQSFKDGGGRVCRHIIVILSAGRRSGRFEGTACRLGGGRWQLEG